LAIFFKFGDGTNPCESRMKAKIEGCPLKIPEVFWKVVYDNKTDSGVAFIVFNSPCYKTKPPLYHTLQNECKHTSQCTNIWEDFNCKNPNRWEDTIWGLTFCCTIKEAFLAFQKHSDFNELTLLKLKQENNRLLRRTQDKEEFVSSEIVLSMMSETSSFVQSLF
jgi:hypothetical protein